MGYVALAFAAAAVVHLLMEQPLGRLQKLLLKK